MPKFSDLRRLEHKIDHLIDITKEGIMQAKEAFARIDAATNDLATRVQAQFDKLTENAGELSPEDQAEQDAIVAKLQGIAKDPNNPVPADTTSSAPDSSTPPAQ